MPITITKTWAHTQVSVGAAGSLLAQNQDMMKRIKDAFLGFGSNPWTVRYSCDGTTAGTAGDAVDRWSSTAALVWANAGSAHSWMVLKQTGVLSNFQFLIDLSVSGVNGNSITLVISPSAGFTGGTITARPTATDEAVLYTAQAWSYGTAAAAQQLTVMHSSDGQCTRVIIWKGAVAAAVWLLDVAQGVPSEMSAWSDKFACWILGTGGGDFNSATLTNVNQTATGKLRSSATNVGSFFLAAEGSAQPAGQAFTIANEASSEFPLGPLSVWSETAEARGRWGYLVDVFLGSSTPVSGDLYPASGTKTLIHAGQMVLPWDNSAAPTGGTARDGDTFAGVTNLTQVMGAPYTVVDVSVRALGPAGVNVPRNMEI